MQFKTIAPVSVDGLSVVPEELLRVASAQLTPSRLVRGPLRPKHDAVAQEQDSAA